MVVETEGTIKIGDANLYTKTWAPDGPLKAKVVFVHGYSDHINRYNAMFTALADAGIEVFGFDQRGWGRSAIESPLWGRTGPTELVLADIATVIESRLPSEVPLFVLGHSMGGGEVITLASMPQYDELIAKVRGWILEAPFIAFAPEQTPNYLTVMLGKLAARVLPYHKMVQEVPPERGCRDPEVVRSMREDKHMHYTGTLEGLAGLLERTTNLWKLKTNTRPLVRSLILFHGTGDKVTSFPRSKAWFDNQKIEDAEFKPYEGWYHVLHGEPEKEIFFKDVIDWINARLGPFDKAEAPAPAAPAQATDAPKPVSEVAEGNTSAAAKPAQPTSEAAEAKL